MKEKTVESGSETSDNCTVANSINKQIIKYMTPPCDLLTWKDMPQHLQFNPYVHKGKIYLFRIVRLILILL